MHESKVVLATQSAQTDHSIRSRKLVLTCAGVGIHIMAQLQNTIESNQPGIRDEEVGGFRALDPKTRQATVLALLNQILSNAMYYQCSTVLLEPEGKDLLVMYGTCGKVVSNSFYPIVVSENLVECLKILVGLDVNQKARPQDGKRTLKLAGQQTEMRVTTVPGDWGETVGISLRSA